MYISHKVLRWTLVPFAFPLIFMLNLLIILQPGINATYIVLFILQCVYYLLVLTGAMLHNVRTGIRALFVPYYLFIMNYAVIKGFFQFLGGHYSVNWQKVKRG
jgi:hypothetical protein